MKKALSLCLALALILCAASLALAEEGTTIRVLTHMANQINAIKEVYEAANPGITVIVDQCNYDALNDQFEILLSAKSDEYDVLIVDGPNTAAYVSRGYLAPLDDAFSAEEINAFSGALVNQGTVKGSFYAAPLGDSCTILYYNKDILAESGIDFDFDQYDGKSRITWEELIDLGNQVTAALDPDGTRFLFPIAFGQVSEVYMMNTLPNSLGGANISEDGLSVAGILDSEPWKQALTFYQDNVNAGNFDRGLGAFEGYNAFYAGKVPFIVMTTDSYNYALMGGMTPENLGFTYQPCFAGHEDQVATACGNWTAAVSAFSGSKEAAADFVKWLTYGEGNDLFLRQESMVPNMPSRFTDELYAVNPALRIAAAESGVTSVVRAVTPGFNEYCAVVNAMWEDIRNGSDIDDCVADAIAQLDSALSYYAE